MGKFSSFVKGIMIGGGIALLLSPKPGKEIRKDLAEKADETLDKVMDYTDKAKETAKDAVDQAKEMAQETTDTVKQQFASKAAEVEEKFDAETEAPVTEVDELDPIEEAMRTL